MVDYQALSFNRERPAMPWFKRNKSDNSNSPEMPEEERTIKTEGLFTKCPDCEETLFKGQLDENLQVCPKCEHHFKIDVHTRLKLLFDNAEYKEFDSRLASTDPLQFVDTKPYKERLEKTWKTTGVLDAVLCARGQVG